MTDAKFILYKKKLFEQYNTVKDLTDILTYSFKTNEEVGKILENETNCDLSMHSIESLDKVKDKKRVWLLAQGWNDNDMDKIFNTGVRKFIIDNTSDLSIFEKHLKNYPGKVDLLLRAKFKERTIHTGKHYVYGLSSSQLNIEIQRIANDKELMSKINNLGIHFHRKTQNLSEWNLKEELEDIADKETLNSIQIVNIGGGLPCRYKNFRIEVIDKIFNKIKKFKHWLNEKNIKIIMEPGRFLAAPCVELETEVKAVYDNNIIINCSVYNSSMDTFIWNIRLLAKDELPDNQGTVYTIKGITPDSMDIFRYKVHLPKKKPGDKITFINAGAYNFSSDFCSLEKLKTEIKD